MQSLVEANEKYEIIVPDNHNDKMNLLYDLILMVYADDVVDIHEVGFCEDAVTQFGMKRDTVAWLLDVFEKRHAPAA